MEAVKAKKPYSTEKPVCLNAADAGALLTATEKAGVKSMVCFSYRYKAAARYARELVQNGTLGDIYHVSMDYLQSWALPQCNTPLVWRFIKEKAGSGALGDLGSHALDLVRFVTGKNYTKVIADAETFIKERPLPGGGSGISDVDDFCNYMTRLEGGASAHFQISRFCYGRGNYQRMEIYGSKGALVYWLDRNQGKDELEICAGKPFGDLGMYIPVQVPRHFAGDQSQSFADILNGRGDGTAATIRDGYENQKVLDAIIASFEEKKWISL
jgi:predicted dehydrogenase